MGSPAMSMEVTVNKSEIKDSTFDVEIPIAGRYRVELSAKGEAILFIEDYINNADGRTYDITAAMPVNSVDQFIAVHKDGSPLNTGVHNMRVNFIDGAATIEWIRFTLLKEHELTPYTLKQNLEGDEWTLVWSDEFEEDGAPDPKVWAYDIGNWGWGNRESHYYTENRLENARCENGRLIIEARKDREDGGWTSARLTTRGRMSLLYGKIEFSAKVSGRDGCWAAIWLLGDAYRDEVSWPYCGELDILENYGWEIWCWGGQNYNLTKCGETQKWDKRFTKTLYTWVPSIAVSAIQIYKGKEFSNWNGSIFITSLKDQSLRKIKFKDNDLLKEDIIFKDIIGK